MSNTTLEEKNKFASECYMAEGYLQKGLDTLKELFGAQILKNGFTHPCTDKAFLCDVLLIAFLRRHVFNPSLKEPLWPMVQENGHADWLNKFWSTHAPFVVEKKGGLNDILAQYNFPPDTYTGSKVQD